MGERSFGTSASANSQQERLDSWKEIAAYLNRDVTTVQRWEKREGMPVHRHLHDRIGSVYAWRNELDAWYQGRNIRLAERTSEALSGARLSAEQGIEPQVERQKKNLFWKVLLAITPLIILTILGVHFWPITTEQSWRNRIEKAHFERITDFEDVEQSATLSRDGHLVAFLSDLDGQMDVWVTQIGSGQFHNLTHGTAPELVNTSIRSLGFSPDGSFVTYWVRRQNNTGGSDISLWSVPTLGGEPRPYMEGVAECEWSPNGEQLVYHTPGPGDPMFISRGTRTVEDRPLYTTATGLHSHFPVWSPDGKFIYFVQGALPDKLDIWRIPTRGGRAKRVTSQNTRVTYPVMLDQHTLVYLATDPDGSGPWLYSVDVDRGVSHRLNTGPDRYTSLAGASDGTRLIATLETPKNSLWTLSIAGSAQASQPAKVPLTSESGSHPRFGRDYLIYVSQTATSASIWKTWNGKATELWRGDGAMIDGAPAISADGRIAFSTRQHGRNRLLVMQDNGTETRSVAGTLNVEGTPAWAPDNQSIIMAADDHGLTRLFRIPLNGGSPVQLVSDYSVGPVWSPDGRYIVFSGADVGTNFAVKAANADGATHSLPSLTLTRGARHLAFLPGTQSLLFLRGEIQHKNLWLKDLTTGKERQLTNLPADFDVADFDISPNGSEVVLQRRQEHSSIVLLTLTNP